MRINIIQKVIDQLRGKNKLIFDYAEINISTICTLKCKECLHIIPHYLFQKAGKDKLKNRTFKELKPIIDNFLNSINKVNHLGLLGGEPRLNKDLKHIINYLAKSTKVEEIEIISNGTMLIDDEELFEALKNEKVVFIVSDYGKLSVHKDELLQILEQKGIKTFIRPCVDSGWWHPGNPETNMNRTEEELKNIYKHCTARCCPLILDGKIYACPKTANSIALNLYKPIGNEYVDLTIKNTRLIRKKLKALQELTYINGCNYCMGNLGPIGIAAEQYTLEDIQNLKQQKEIEQG